MSSFTLQVAQFADKAGADITEVVTKAVLEIYAGVVMKSPVDSGRFRGNWVVTTNAPASGVVDTLDRLPLNTRPGDVVAHRARMAMVNFKLGETVYITNHLPYAYRLEYEGWSTQAPAGMVRTTVLAWQSLIAQAVAELK